MLTLCRCFPDVRTGLLLNAAAERLLPAWRGMHVRYVNDGTHPGITLCNVATLTPVVPYRLAPS